LRLIRSSPLGITFVTAGELHKWAHVHRWGARSRGGFELWLDLVPILPYDPEVARVWGLIAAGAQLRGRPRPENDTWVAACCIQVGLPLLTQNQRDFVDFAEHNGLVLTAI
jgi:predicted nucleic acid-binding protein